MESICCGIIGPPIATFVKTAPCVCPNVITDRFEEGIESAPQEVRDYLIASMSQNAMHRPGRAYEDATPAILFLACDDSRWVTGQTLHVEGGNWIGA